MTYKTPEGLKAGKVKKHFKGLFIGGPGDGKTHLAHTFPKCMTAITATGEEDTFLYKPELLKNVICWEHFIPSKEMNLLQTISGMAKFVDDAYEKAVKGEIETFILDNLTMYAIYEYMNIEENEKHLHLTKQGKFDTQNAYGTLRNKLIKFVLYKVLTIPCNVIINVHLMVESDETLDKKPDKTIPYSPNILGSFRDIVIGLVSYAFYLEKKAKEGGFEYRVRTNKGGGKNAKSRLTLPNVIANVDYNEIMKVINETQKGETK